MKIKETTRKKISATRARDTTKITQPCQLTLISMVTIQGTRELTTTKNGNMISSKTKGIGTIAIKTSHMIKAILDGNNNRTISSRLIRSVKIDTTSRTTDQATTKSTSATNNTSTLTFKLSTCSRLHQATWKHCTRATTLVAVIFRSIYNR